MSIISVSDAFSRGIGSAASVDGATMTYEDGGRLQRVTFTITTPAGEKRVIAETVPAHVDLITKATAMGADTAASLHTGA